MADISSRLTVIGMDAGQEELLCDPATGACYRPSLTIPDFASTWDDAMTLDAYVAGMRHQQAAMQRRLRDVTLPAEQIAGFGQLTQAVHVLVVTEDWCGDSLMNVPILARLVEAAPGLTLRVVRRSEAPQLETYYSTRGITHTPVFSFLDKAFAEIGVWVERPQAAQQRLAAWMATHAEIKQILRDSSLSRDARRQKVAASFPHMLAEMEQWYTQELQAATVAEIRTLLAPWLPTSP